MNEELPDPIFGFKNTTIYFNNLTISSREKDLQMKKCPKLLILLKLIRII